MYVPSTVGDSGIRRMCSHIECSFEACSPSGSVLWRLVRSGNSWLQLRMCMECGYVGCCDSSKNGRYRDRTFSRHTASDRPFGPARGRIGPGAMWISYGSKNWSLRDPGGGAHAIIDIGARMRRALTD